MEIKSAYLLTFLICWAGVRRCHKMFSASFTPSGLSSPKKCFKPVRYFLYVSFPCT